jgi:hypothetical protein
MSRFSDFRVEAPVHAPFHPSFLPSSTGARSGEGRPETLSFTYAG